MNEMQADARKAPQQDIFLSSTDEPAHPIEVEVKFRTDAKSQGQVLRSPLLGPAAARKAQTLRSIYFDSKNLDLLKHGVVLRVRKTGQSGPVMCVKFQGSQRDGVFQRREIEVKSPDLSPDLKLFDETTAAKLLRILDGQKFEPQFETRIKRRLRHVTTGTLSVEVAIDEGFIALPDGRQEPLREVELELKSGEPADLYDLASRLAMELSLTLDFASKPETGFALFKPETSVPRKAAALVLDEHASLDMAVVAVISNTLRQFASNWTPLRNSDDPESVHQLRVSLRRMRIALKMFKRVLPCQAFDGIRADAKQIATALGPARELDIFILGAADGPLQYGGKPHGCADLMAAAAEARASAYRAARALIDDPQTTLFVLKLQSLVARGAWRSELPSTDLPLLTSPAKEIAVSILDWLQARVSKRGKRLMQLSDEERHELRIALKDLRYGVEFFSGPFGHGRRVRTLLKTVSALQDLLGRHNDSVSTEKLVQIFSQGLGAEAVRAAGYVTGWHARGIAMAEAELEKLWKSFKSQRPFWH